MDGEPAALPDNIEALKAAPLAERARADAAQAEAAAARAESSDAQALIAYLKLQIEKYKREHYGQRSESSKRLLDQLELQLEELEASATEDELRAEQDAAKTMRVGAFNRDDPFMVPHLFKHLERLEVRPVDQGDTDRVARPGPRPRAVPADRWL